MGTGGGPVVKNGLHNGKPYCLGSGVAPQTPIPVYPIGQQRCFRIPRMVVFELHNGKTYCSGSGGAPQSGYEATRQTTRQRTRLLGNCVGPLSISTRIL